MHSSLQTEKKELALENPATGELLTTVTLADEIDTERAIDAFSFAYGLGFTITGDDLLNVFMNVNVKVAVAHPSEFIVLTFQQQMATSIESN